jgi:hypothetical protein
MAQELHKKVKHVVQEEIMSNFHISNDGYFQRKKIQRWWLISHLSVYLFLYSFYFYGLWFAFTDESFCSGRTNPTPLIILGGTNVNPAANQPLKKMGE